MAFSTILGNYFVRMGWFYFILILLSTVAYILYQFNRMSVKPSTISGVGLIALALFFPLLTMLAPIIINWLIFERFQLSEFSDFTLSFKWINSISNILFSISLISALVKERKSGFINHAIAMKAVRIQSIIYAFSIIASLLCGMRVYGLANVTENSSSLVLLISMLVALSTFGYMLKKGALGIAPNTNLTTGNYGTAEFATRMHLAEYNAYNPQTGIPSGVDEKGKIIYLPLLNRLTLAPPGFLKSVSSSIPCLLRHRGPAFILDPKGELWSVTARHRMEKFGHKIVVIDPYGITDSEDFRKGKPEKLLNKNYFNPFDWVPEDPKQRDRMINTFAASFIINESESGKHEHFNENARILIRGYIDYMMTALPKEQRTLEKLYQLMSEGVEEAEVTFKEMIKIQNSRARAAANQVERVGEDECGSILSTSYRQIDWMGDRNIQELLSHSNFDLEEFIKGNMDIYVIIPEDQTKEHSRLFRMIMALLNSIIIRTPPSKLTKKKIIYLMEELAQFGYTPDVEDSIEILRARKIVVWSVFQTLKQINNFKKNDLFLGMEHKQVFTNDDLDTMRWLQAIAGKATVEVKSLSTNSSDTHQKMQMLSGQTSKSEGENLQETGVDLIHINQIRELPRDEQFIFQLTRKLIKCKKIIYYDNPIFKGEFDPNPIEENNKEEQNSY